MLCKASYEEFLELNENSDERYEYIDEGIYLIPAPDVHHQMILGKLHSLFYTRFRESTCRPFISPYEITLRRNNESINVVLPDLMVICDIEKHLDERDYYIGVPHVVVEIVSEHSRQRDLVKKLDLYMSTGIKEYWIVNPLNREVSIYLFEEKAITKNITFKNHETASSYYFNGLDAKLEFIFA